MTTGEFRKLNQHSPSNRHLVMMISFGILALGSYSFYSILLGIQQQEQNEIQNSKLDEILSEANNTDIVVYVLPNKSVTNESLGKISSLDESPIIIK